MFINPCRRRFARFAAAAGGASLAVLVCAVGGCEGGGDNQASTRGATESASAGGARDGSASAGSLQAALGENVVDASGRTIPASHFDGKEYVLFYSSAAWCGPCRAFTPKLVDFYNDHGGGGRFEVVFVSSDRNAQAASEYMRDYEMPWTMIPFEDERLEAAKEYRSGRGIPDLVAVDAESGEVIAASYVNGHYLGPQQVLAEMSRRLATN